MEANLITREQDRAFMTKAVALSRECKPEDDRVHPYVGAVIVTPDGAEIATGYRGQRNPGHHAEQEALNGQRPDVLRGAIVYTTLEPCTVRGKRTPCSSLLVKAEVSEVVIGMLDPNRDIRGKGWWELEQAPIRVRYFDPDIVQGIRRLNQGFIEYQLGVGLLITAIQPRDSAELEVTADHRVRQKLLAVPNGKLTVRGNYRVKPRRGDRIVLLVHRGNRYFPQQAIDFDHDRDKRLWQAPSAWVGVTGQDAEDELVIARVSDDLSIAFEQYSTVHSDLTKDHNIDKWIGVIMNTEPPGFERLASVWVRSEG
jgi:pyrimidine deaminase RibD-like protein